MAERYTHDIVDCVWSERWRLGRLYKNDLIKIALGSVIIGLMYLLFQFFGNVVADVRSPSAFRWMISRWQDEISFGADYSHGYLIPFVSLGVIWMKRKEFLGVEKSVSRPGLFVVIGALLIHWMGVRMAQTRLSLGSFILLLWGIPFYFYGWKMAKLLMFPCSYLLFCVPLNFLDGLGLRLRLVSTNVATVFMNAVGIAADQQGSYITLMSGFKFNVDDPCSGLRSLLAMTALTAVYAYMTQPKLWQKWLLFILSMPLAVAGNMARIITIALVAQAHGREFAMSIYHDYSGYIAFIAAVFLMVLTGKLVKLPYKAIFVLWRRKILNHMS